MSVAATTETRGWDEASGTISSEAVSRFEAAWRASPPNRKPDPLSFAPEGPPGVRLALLRADLGLRWEAGDSDGAERYRGLGLSEDAMIALVYEEFCLREERGESPNPSTFCDQFPEIARGLKRVLDIHDLVGSGHAASTASFNAFRSSSVPFPEAGQTIAGFHLVEELGRGGFARVFLAKERQLGDRPVALKVARTGSKEPQTLARLQHTHIVPVHSYRIDPATGLHLLCMPYFGRVTLAHVLADPAVKDALEGSELIAVLDRLDRDGAGGTTPTTGRQALASRPYARAIAWWGARLAEALQHAHDRGVLHRDVKPSNVLVTADGMPMLLDFNLAHDPFDPETGESPSALGGTVAYMSPEHLEALADGRAEGGDGRSDIYALGVVLFEAMGARPFGPPPNSRSVTEALLRAAEQRKTRPPRLRDRFPEAPASLDAVVTRCLAPDPSQRYKNALQLAQDLQAVADDSPLIHAREPIHVRVAAKIRRHRRAMSATALLLTALGLAVFYSIRAHEATERNGLLAQASFNEGERAEAEGKFAQARELFLTADRLSAEYTGLAALNRKAKLRAKIATQAERISEYASEFFSHSNALRFHLLNFDGDRKYTGPSLEKAMGPFFVKSPRDWADNGELLNLGSVVRDRLVREVHELLFLAAVRLAELKSPARLDEALELCNRALAIRESRLASIGSHPSEVDPARDAESLPEATWSALKRYIEAKQANLTPSPISPPRNTSRITPWECYSWGRLLLLEGRRAWPRSAAWIDTAARRDPGRFWLEFDAAYRADQAGSVDQAFEHYTAAVELDPHHARARLNRARIFRRKGDWGKALSDLNYAVKHDPELVEAVLERGVVEQTIGNLEAARASYTAVINSKHAGAHRNAAILNRSKLDFDAGRTYEAIAALDDLILQFPDDLSARQGRAVIAILGNDPARADLELTQILRKRPTDAEALFLRASARLQLGQVDEAGGDAYRAATVDPSPRRQRLLTRIMLAQGRFSELRFDDPDEIRLLPSGPKGLVRDLRMALDALKRGMPSPAVRSTRAVIFAALGEQANAENEASLAVGQAPMSPRGWLVRARVRRDRGDRRGALSDVRRGLELEPEDPRLVGLLGMLRIETGDIAGALADLDRASRRGGGPALDRPKAEARTRLGQGRAAVVDWTQAIERDLDDPSLFIGRARAFIVQESWDRALADLERAAESANGRPEILASVAFTYARCIPARPDHWRRVVAILEQFGKAAIPTSLNRNGAGG